MITRKCSHSDQWCCDDPRRRVWSMLPTIDTLGMIRSIYRIGLLTKKRSITDYNYRSHKRWSIKWNKDRSRSKQKEGWKQFEALHAQQQKGLKHFEKLNSKQEIGRKQLEKLHVKQENGLKNIEAQQNSNQDALLNSIENFTNNLMHLRGNKRHLHWSKKMQTRRVRIVVGNCLSPFLIQNTLVNNFIKGKLGRFFLIFLIFYYNVPFLWIANPFFAYFTFFYWY